MRGVTGKSGWAGAVSALALGALVLGPGSPAVAGAMAPPGPGLVPGMTPAPNRHVPFGRNCPPNGAHRSRPQQPPDRDVDGDGRPDYFMGSWTFVDSREHGVVITLWCLRRKPATRVVRGRRRFDHYNDVFALQIATRATGSAPLVTRVAPVRPICPFVEGVNLGLGFRPQVCLGIAQPPFDQIPPVITWISVNQHIAGDQRPGVGAVEHLYWPQADGGIVQGRIVKSRDRSYRFVGSFSVAGAVKPAHGLTAGDRRLLVADMTTNIVRARRENRGCDNPSFGTAATSRPPAPRSRAPGAGSQPPDRLLSRAR